MAELKPFTEPSQWAYGRSYAAAAVVAVTGADLVISDAGGGAVTAGEALNMTAGATNLELTASIAGWYLVNLTGSVLQATANEQIICSLFKTPSGGAAAVVTGSEAVAESSGAALAGPIVSSAVIFLAASDKVHAYARRELNNMNITFNGSLTAVRVR